MRKFAIVIAAALAAVLSGCSLNIGNGMFVYENPRFGGVVISRHKSDTESHTVFDTGGGAGESILDGSVRAWAIGRIKSGETVDQVSRAMGIDPSLLREWIK